MSTLDHRAATTRVDGYAPIGSYAAIGDGRTVALVCLDGAIDWLPIPTTDARTVFAALLDPDRGGAFRLCPTEPFQASRRYIDCTNVLETTFTTADGVVKVRDALDLQDGGQLSWVELARQVQAVDGHVSMRYELTPRFSYGAAEVRLDRRGDWIHAAGPSQDMAFAAWGAGGARIEEGTISGEFELARSDEALLACVFVEDEPIPHPPRRAIELRIDQTCRAWRDWISFHSYEGRWREPVERSLLALKLLMDAQTGAIVAAPTTSLPERIGGTRNYDYRYAWIRDSAFSLDAFGAAGFREQVHGSLSWVLAASKSTHPRMEPFYSLAGRVPRGESELPLAGYRASKPVLRGNNASGQLQLGCYGNLLETVELYVSHGNALDEQTAIRVGEVADHVCRIWRNEDSGIWELPRQRHYTSSKINCWVALDRALRLAKDGHVPAAHADRWREQASSIRSWVQERCWSERQGSYSFFAGSDELDAAVLLAARTGFLDGEDPRLHTTIDAIARELSAGGPLLYRYSGQEGKEGAFLACSFWMVEALVRAGQSRQASEMMEELLALANDVGLYSEEMDPAEKELLGNFPQGLSHLSLVNAAHAFAAAQRDEERRQRDQESGQRDQESGQRDQESEQDEQ